MSAVAAPTTDTVLTVRDLAVQIDTREGAGRVVDGVSFTLRRGETLGIVGESGSGKSMTALSVVGLNPRPASKVVAGEAWLGDLDLLAQTDAGLEDVRGSRIGMVLQDPLSALNPVMRIGDQVTEAVRLHKRLSRAGARDLAADLLDRLKIPDPRARLLAYPHELSGGMRQRVVGAIALAGDPEILIADEPTTSLDTTVQADYLRLLKDVQRERRLAILFITHDFGVVAAMCDRVAVMYAGRIVETGPVEQILTAARHPYTRALVRSVPDVRATPERLQAIGGNPASIFDDLPGCRFAPRCEHAQDRCRRAYPDEVDVQAAHTVSCWRWKELV